VDPAIAVQEFGDAPGISTWRSTRRATVSMPCSNKNALRGASTAPVVR